MYQRTRGLIESPNSERNADAKNLKEGEEHIRMSDLLR